MNRLFLTAIAFAPIALAGCSPSQAAWADDCESAFKSRLRSPATYQRVDLDIHSESVALDEYIQGQPELTKTEIDALKLDQTAINKWTVLITYDAENAFGALVRDKFYCDAVTTGDDQPKGGRDETSLKLLMEVNGVSGQRWQMQSAGLN